MRGDRRYRRLHQGDMNMTISVFEEETKSFTQKYKNNETGEEISFVFTFRSVNEFDVMKTLSAVGELDEIKDLIDPNITDVDAQADQVSKLLQSDGGLDKLIQSQTKIIELMADNLVSAPELKEGEDTLVYLKKLKMAIRMKLLEDFSNEFVSLEGDTIGKKWDRA